jgi:hypothetical protein
MADEHMVMAEIAQSNIPSAKKSAIRRWAEGVMGVAGGTEGIKRHASETAHVFRQGAEAAVAGGLLGMLAAERGSLDIHYRGHEIPIDGVVALVGLGGAVFMARDPMGLSVDMRNVGSDALAIYAFRKAQAWRLQSKHGRPAASGPAAHHGDVDDPIVAASQALQG